MKTTPAIAILTLQLIFALNSSAATQVTCEIVQRENLQSMGTVTASGIDGSVDTISHQLSIKADKKGASKYRVIEAYTNGTYHGTAEIYR